MPAVRDRQIQSEFQDGMVRGQDRSEIGKAACYDIENGLLDEGGDPYRRGGTAYKSKSGLAGEKVDWGFDGYFLPGRRTLWVNDAADYVAVLAEDDETPVIVGEPSIVSNAAQQAAQLQNILFFAGELIYAGSLKKGPYTTGTVKVEKGSKQVKGTGTAFKANVDVGTLFRIDSSKLYVVEAVPSDTELVLSEKYAAETESGKAYIARAVFRGVEMSFYRGDLYKTVCANRLVSASKNSIYFTEVNNPHTFKNSLGTENVHELPKGVEPLGLATVGQTVLVFTTDGLWTLEGLALAIVDQNGNSQHRLQRLSADVLLTGALGLSMWEQRIIAPTSGGIVALDDTSAPQILSEQIEGHYQSRLLAGWKVGQAEVYRDHYLLPMINSEGNATEALVCRLDKPTRRGPPWTRLTEHGGKIKAFFVRGAAPSTGLLLGGHGSVARIINCSSYFTPEAAFKNDADGSAHCLTVIPRDFDTGQLTFNAVRRALLRYEGRGNSGDEPIVRFFWSKGETADFGPQDETDESGALYYLTAKKGGLSDGRDPVSFTVNKSLRRGRFLIKTEKAFASFALRSIEIDIRPVGTGRR